MFTTALIGVDLSAAEDPLIECVSDLATWGVGRIVLAHVIHVDYGRFAGLGHEDRYRDWLEQRAEPLRAGGLEVQTSVTASGRPAAELLARAREHGADLVVVGSRSQRLTERLFLGSVATEVIRSSELPVLVERLERDLQVDEERCVAACSRALERVLLATDLSDQSAAAEDAVVELAERAGSIDCLIVVDDAAHGVAVSADHVEGAAASIVERITAAGGRGTVRIEHGDARERIPAIAAEGYSMVVVGKHGHGRVTGAVIGTTAARVAEAAGVSVLLVPA
ncbi:MAG: universal stress protein [Acidimicrobiales bacterium]|nr:universal stress protein [Acidimicrobiales bacterium]